MCKLFPPSFCAIGSPFPSNTAAQFLQYLALTPTYINILNVYAFCNTHDISWGTKGDDKAPKLDSINIKPDGKVDVTIPKDDGDLNSQYEAEMRKFADKAPKVKKEISASDKQADYYNDFRSSVVLAWMFTNFGLCALVLSTAGLNRVEVGSSDVQRSTIYMNVVLWSVAALSAFRFCGAVWFLIVRRVSLASPFFRHIFTSTRASLRHFANGPFQYSSEASKVFAAARREYWVFFKPGYLIGKPSFIMYSYLFVHVIASDEV